MSKLMLVGGPDSGKHHRFFGPRVRIDRIEYVQHRAYFKDGSRKEYYVISGMHLVGMLDESTLDRIEVCG